MVKWFFENWCASKVFNNEKTISTAEQYNHQIQKHQSPILFSMKNILIRTATLKDLPTLLEFEQGIITAERPFDPTLAADPISYYDLKVLIELDTAEVIVAEVDNQIVASAYAKIKKGEPFFQFEEYAYLGFMFVRPEFRGQGINQKIVDELVRWVKSRNLTELRLQVYEENAGALRAYEKAGFKKYMMTMRLGV